MANILLQSKCMNRIIRTDRNNQQMQCNTLLKTKIHSLVMCYLMVKLKSGDANCLEWVKPMTIPTFAD